MKLTRLVFLASILSLTGCSIFEPRQVAVACPPFPLPPQVVMDEPALKPPSLAEEWQELRESYNRSLTQAINSYNKALAESLNEAAKPNSTLKPAKPGL